MTMPAHSHIVFIVSCNEEAVNILSLGKFFVQKVFVKVNRLSLRTDYPFCSHFIHSYTATVGLVIWEVSFHVIGTERCHVRCSTEFCESFIFGLPVKFLSWMGPFT